MSNKFHLCCDCGESTYELNEYYVVWDHIWELAPNKKGMLCIGCLETRLGRKLNSTDFPPLPVNTDHLGFRSTRLVSRIESPPTVFGRHIQNKEWETEN
jgi:hypothetical protein